MIIVVINDVHVTPQLHLKSNLNRLKTDSNADIYSECFNINIGENSNISILFILLSQQHS